MILTVDEFIQSIESCQPGDSGFCKLASVSAGNNEAIYNIGFQFKVIKNNGTVVLLVKLKSITSDELEQIIDIAVKKHSFAFIENMRQWAVDELSSFLYHSPKSLP